MKSINSLINLALFIGALLGTFLILEPIAESYFITKTPEVIFEVLSPSTARRDEGLKFNMYKEEGVKYYTLVYPDDLIAKIYKLQNNVYIKVAECDSESFSFEEITCPIEFYFTNIFNHFRKNNK